jgi:hypothetical protein
MNQFNNFLIIKNIKSFILGLEKLLVLVPKKDFFTRNMVYQDTLELLELVEKANYEFDINLKRNYQICALAKLHKIDFYIERAYKLGYISERQCTNKSRELSDISKMIYTWCKNEK